MIAVSRNKRTQLVWLASSLGLNITVDGNVFVEDAALLIDLPDARLEFSVDIAGLTTAPDPIEIVVDTGPVVVVDDSVFVVEILKDC